VEGKKGRWAIIIWYKWTGKAISVVYLLLENSNNDDDPKGKKMGEKIFKKKLNRCKIFKTPNFKNVNFRSHNQKN
jgi:hypothetical protein